MCLFIPTGLPLFERMSSDESDYLSVDEAAVAAPFDCPPLPAACLALGK